MCLQAKCPWIVSYHCWLQPRHPLVQPFTQRFALETRTCLMTQFPLTITMRIEVMASCLQSASAFCACRLAWKPAEVSSCQVEKPIVIQLVKKCLMFYGTRMFSTMFAKSSPVAPFLRQVSSEYVCILKFCKYIFHSLQLKFCTHFSSRMRITSSSHLILLILSFLEIFYEKATLRSVFVLFSPFCYCFLSLMSSYCPHNPIPKHSESSC